MKTRNIGTTGRFVLSLTSTSVIFTKQACILSKGMSFFPPECAHKEKQELIVYRERLCELVN